MALQNLCNFFHISWNDKDMDEGRKGTRLWMRGLVRARMRRVGTSGYQNVVASGHNVGLSSCEWHQWHGQYSQF